MININSEMLVSSLFELGFDSVDSMLFTYTLGKLSLDNYKLNLFEFKDDLTTNTFNKYVDYNGITFKLKEGYSLDTNVSPIEGHNFPLRYALQTNKKLLEYLQNVDFKEIVSKKISTVGYDRLERFDYIFSTKEKQIILEMSETQSIKNTKVKTI